MSFEATIFIQGVGNYRLLLDAEGKERGVDVLFPDGTEADRQGLKDPNGKQVCKHEAVVHVHPDTIVDPLDAGLWKPNLDRLGQDDGSRKLSIEGQRVELFAESDPGSPVEFRARRDDNRRDGGIFGLPRLEDFLAEAKWNGAVIDEEPPLTASRIRFERGVLGPESDFLGAWEVPSPERGRGGWEKQLLSSVMKVELGVVNHLELRLVPLDAAPGTRPTVVPLRARGSFLDVWIRHFCILDWPPQPDLSQIRTGKPDLDFVLNYALVRDLQDRNRKGLPVPRVWESWVGGGPVGGDPSLCQGSENRGGG